MRRAVEFLLVVLAVTPLLGQEPAPDDMARRLETAKADLAAATEAAAARYKEIEADFDLVRSDLWIYVRAPYVKAIAEATADGPPLEGAFAQAMFLSETTCRRLAAEVTKLLATGPGDPGAVLDKGLAAVFPKTSFAECWEDRFLDLPEVARIALAAEAVKAAEAALAGGAGPDPVKPPVAPPPEEVPTDHPPGMVLVPKGAFEFGPWTGWTSDLKTNRAGKERVEAFFIDVHEVTNAQYREFLAKLPKNHALYGELPEGFIRTAGGDLTLPEGAENLPVRGVSYAMAEAYAESVDKRLPTEEEWEKAARGEDGLAYPWGPEYKEGAANLKDSGLGGLAPVGSFEGDRSPYGVMDMAGNVAEITATLDGRRPVGRKLKPTDSIILRGGSVNEGKDGGAATYRWILPAISKGEWAGFRCAMSEKAFKRPPK